MDIVIDEQLKAYIDPLTAEPCARACLDLATGALGQTQVIAIIDPANSASRRVAEKLGMRPEQETEAHGRHVVVYGCRAGE